jgi:Cu2+-exporting ATPase
MKKTFAFFSQDITCTVCAGNIEEQIQGTFTLDNGKTVKIEATTVANFEKRIHVTVHSETDEKLDEKLIVEKLIAWIDDIGYRCQLIPESKKTNKPIEPPENPLYLYLFNGSLGLLAGATLLTLSLLSITIPPIPMFLVAISACGLVLYLGIDSYIEAFEKLFKAKTLTMDTLFTVASLVALGISLVGLFIPGLPNLFGAALLIFGFRYIGKAIEASAKKAVVSQISFRDRTPDEVSVIDDKNRISQRKLSDIELGDVITIAPGQVIPLDGSSVNDASVYKTIITGSTLPEKVKADEKLLAGMQVTGTSALQLRVTATEENSYLAKMDKEICEAEQKKAPIETKANRILHFFIPLVFILAIASGICVGCFYAFSIAIQCVVAVLVSACPCTLGLIVPLAIKIGLAKAARHGAQFTGGESLEKAAHIDTIVFDLNGTLTTGIPSVKETRTYENENTIFPYLIALETSSAHPFAKAICQNFAKWNTHSKSLTVVDMQTDHCGRRATIQGQIYTVGNRSMMQQYNIPLPKEDATQSGAHQIFFARGDTILARITLTDPLRKDAKEVIAALQNSGKIVHLCTGADRITALSYATELGILAANVAADYGKKEESKLHYIKKLQAKGNKVAMVGDGGNDASAVEGSDLGIAIKSAASDSVTQSRAGVVIEKGALSAIPFVFSIAEDAVNNIQQNLAISLTYNILILIFAGGLLLTMHCSMNPGIGVALMILQMCFVLANAYRFNRSGADIDPKIVDLELEDTTKGPFNDDFVFSHLSSQQPSTAKKDGIFVEKTISTSSSSPSSSTLLSL